MIYFKKQNILTSLILLLSLHTNTILSSMWPHAYQYEQSKTTLKTRQLSSYGMPLVDAQMAMPLAKEKSDKVKSTIALYCIGITANTLARSNFGDYFSIDQKDTMKIKGDQAPNKEDRDIRAEYVGGLSTTDLEISLKGKSDLAGAKFLFQLSLEEIFKHCFFHNWFLSLRGAFTHNEQKLSFEKTGNKDDTDFISIQNFFANRTKNALINGQNHAVNGLENITLTLDGLYTSTHNAAEIYYYTGIEIPTTLDYDTSENLFYPTIGNNGHIGLIVGGDFHIFLHQWQQQRLGLLLEIENHFLLYKTVKRVFDLYQNKYSPVSLTQENNINKPWSRYLPAFNLQNSAEPQTTVSSPSNLRVRIHPCDNLDVSAGILYDIQMLSESRWIFALGYNLWMSQPEYIELQDRVYAQDYKNFYQYGILGSTTNKTSSESTISDQASNDENNQHFNFLSLDYGSAASNGGYSNSVFLRGSFIGASGVSCLIGGFYEIGKNKVIPSRAGGWIGLGLEY